VGQDKSEIRHQIIRTRARLGETIDALTYKLDVKSRVREALGERMDEAKRVVRSTVSTVTNVATEQARKATEQARKASETARSAGEAARNATDAARTAIINNVKREEPGNGGRPNNSPTGARAS
jgi:hypothetical protein